MIPLADKEVRSYEKQKVCHICKKNLVLMKMRKKLLLIVITLGNLDELLIIFVI